MANDNMIQDPNIHQAQGFLEPLGNAPVGIASVGFTVVDKGSLCDDRLNYREYWLLQRS